MTLDEAKELLRIPEIWHIKNLPHSPGKSCRSPFREDKHPSFSVYDDGKRCKDFGTGWEGDAPDFLAKTEGVTDPKETVRRFMELTVSRYGDNGAPLPSTKHYVLPPKIEIQKNGAEPQTLRKLCGADLLNYSARKINTSDTLLGKDRYLCRGGSLLVPGPSGQGKSVMSIQMTVEMAARPSTFGICVPKPLRILDIQAEDDEGDLIEMAKIVDHLGLSPEERELVRKNTWIETVNDLTGRQLVDLIDHFLTQRPVDIVKMNPFSSYLGSEVKDDKAATLFLRNQINPMLARHRVGFILFAHTPKTNFRDTSGWSITDWLYSAAGAATIANWARAIIALEPTETQGVYRLIAAKRYQRIGWPQPEQYWAHSRKPGQLLWVPADHDQIASAKETAKKGPDDLLDLIPVLDPITQAQFFLAAKERKNIGVNKARDFVNVLLTQGKAHAWKMPREKPLKAEIGYARHPQSDLTGES